MLLDDLIPVGYQNDIEQLVNDYTFPWYTVNEISPGKFNDDLVTDSFGISHNLFCSQNGVSSQHFGFFKPILYFLEQRTGVSPRRILRIRIRRTFNVIGHNETKYNRPHVDLPKVEPFTTLVYYIDETDGDVSTHWLVFAGSV